MFARTVAALVLSLLIVNVLSAQDNKPKVHPGDLLAFEMTGNLAKEYATRCGDDDLASRSGLRISTCAYIEQIFDDGKIRVEISSPVLQDKKPIRLITLSAIVDGKDLTTYVTSKGTPVYDSPEDVRNGVVPKVTKDDKVMLQLELSELKNVKLRTWTLAEEIGD